VYKKNLIAARTDHSMDAVKYLNGFNAGLTKPAGTQYLCNYVAFPSYMTVEWEAIEYK
jgi:hypothetical protein